VAAVDGLIRRLIAEATRINRFPGSTWLLLQQDRHLIHHLYPTIPWYR